MPSPIALFRVARLPLVSSLIAAALCAQGAERKAAEELAKAMEAECSFEFHEIGVEFNLVFNT